MTRAAEGEEQYCQEIGEEFGDLARESFWDSCEWQKLARAGGNGKRVSGLQIGLFKVHPEMQGKNSFFPFCFYFFLEFIFQNYFLFVARSCFYISNSVGTQNQDLPM